MVLVLSIIGILVVGSANESYQSKQIFGVVIGLVVMAIVSLIDYVWITNFYWILYGMSVFMLAIVLIPRIGVYVNGARRWINLGFTNFQPSELAKILLIIFFAKFIMKHKEDLSEKQTILKAVVLIAIPLVLILKEPNLSTTICTATLFCFLMYVGGSKLSVYWNGASDHHTCSCYFLKYCCTTKSEITGQIISRSVFLPGWSRKNTQVTKLISKTIPLWQSVPDSLPERVLIITQQPP